MHLPPTPTMHLCKEKKKKSDLGVIIDLILEKEPQRVVLTPTMSSLTAYIDLLFVLQESFLV